ncbi:DUF3597 family protein [Paraburkholderia terrae]|uniref:DUF3597 family protein n=1 Tax=Paraburkholderia terrae TaxID=311230 RepID=UPI002852800F|nr:DUF3597 family protein [Paraburkholderia terrae]
MLTQMQASHNEPLNWRTFIVDLLKVLGLDSSRMRGSNWPGSFITTVALRTRRQ